ncbi:hypothetical protein TNCV_2325531 [Trichonephila clavipes]|nr:hypothetical protein TNCV_2325531 [Trichonephila clavipes]
MKEKKKIRLHNNTQSNLQAAKNLDNLYQNMGGFTVSRPVRNHVSTKREAVHPGVPQFPPTTPKRGIYFRRMKDTFFLFIINPLKRVVHFAVHLHRTLASLYGNRKTVYALKKLFSRQEEIQ